MSRRFVSSVMLNVLNLKIQRHTRHVVEWPWQYKGGLKDVDCDINITEKRGVFRNLFYVKTKNK